MKLPNNKFLLQLTCILTIITCGCTKDAFNKKSDASLTTVNSVSDLQKLYNGLSIDVFESYKSLGNVLADDSFYPDDVYNSLPQQGPQGLLYQRASQFSKNLFNGMNSLPEWDGQYQVVLITNTILEQLQRFSLSEQSRQDFNELKGAALFARSMTFMNLADYWGQPYNKETADKDLGIVLKTNSDVSEILNRSTNAETYNQIEKDLKEASVLLPNLTANTTANKVLPSKAAAYALLARMYLTKQDYANVKFYTDSCLQLYSTLMDYNNQLAQDGFNNFNEEIIFDAGDPTFVYARPTINDDLYQSYSDNDLRKVKFFSKGVGDDDYTFNGDYAANYRFNGLATDEVYLMRAEANARLGNTSLAMNDLNTLLITRFKSGTFIPYHATDASDALKIIINERRKELVMRGLRWPDLRRLNQDSRFAITFSRTIDGKAYTLPANDSRYALQIPPYIISFSNTIQQNP